MYTNKINCSNISINLEKHFHSINTINGHEWLVKNFFGLVSNVVSYVALLAG